MIGDWHQLPQAAQRRNVMLPRGKLFVMVLASAGRAAPQTQASRGSNSNTCGMIDLTIL
jgi:hypothetical protein